MRTSSAARKAARAKQSSVHTTSEEQGCFFETDVPRGGPQKKSDQWGKPESAERRLESNAFNG
jgi:hypothetical protein